MNPVNSTSGLWLKSGGIPLLLIVLLSVVALSIIIVKAWEFRDWRLNRRRFVAHALEAWQLGRFDSARKQVSGEKNPIAQAMKVAMDGLTADLPEDMVREQTAQTASERLDAARNHFRTLEIISQVAPLLGLLGTTLGMISAFAQLQSGGATADPSRLSGGIAQALVTTAGGLMLAIPVMSVLGLFERWVEHLQVDMEAALTRLLTLPRPSELRLANGGSATPASSTMVSLPALTLPPSID